MVRIIDSKKELLQSRRLQEGSIGYVPTMGNLHAGHLSLLNQALKEFQTVYFSIFVNPKQFGPTEDFNRYPRTLQKDVELLNLSLRDFNGREVILYSPKDPLEVFPKNDDLKVTVAGLSQTLEGEKRPGHFCGVTTVVYRLFELIKPTKAYFGLKDYQQFQVIKQMVSDLHLNIEIVGMPIIREPLGLALSSRNQYLSDEQKHSALILYESLKRLKATVERDRDTIGVQSLIADLLRDPNWDYLEIRDSSSFSRDIHKSTSLTVLGAYQLGTTRLLDNMQVEIK